MPRNQSVSTHQFSMVPRSDVPRSKFNMQTSHKTTFNAGYLIPIYVDEVLPGDSFPSHDRPELYCFRSYGYADFSHYG